MFFELTKLISKNVTLNNLFGKLTNLFVSNYNLYVSSF